MLKEIFEVFFGRSWAGFFKSVGKIRDPDSNESLKPVDYDAKKNFAADERIGCKLVIKLSG